MMDQLHDSEMKLEQELSRMRIVASLDEVQRMHVHTLAAAAFYSISKDESIGDKHMAGLKELVKKLKRLRELTEGNPEFAEKTKELQKAIIAVVPYEMMMRKFSLMESKPQYGESNKARGLIKRSMQLVHDYQSTLIAPTGNVKSFTRSSKELQMRLAMILVILTGVTVSFLYWSQSYIVNAINTLLEQIKRFRNGVLLKPSINTNDELAELEVVLCDSANSITKFEEFRQNLCAVVSHDIRAPMTSIAGLVTLFETGALGQLSTKYEAINKRLKTTCADLIALINNILDLDKLKSGKWKMSIEEHSCDIVLKKIESELSTFSYSGINCNFEPGTIDCDLDVIAKTSRTLVEGFADESSSISINVQSQSCTISIKNAASTSDSKSARTLALAQVFCEKQSMELIQSNENNDIEFSITTKTEPETDKGPEKETRPEKLSTIGKTLLILIGRPMAVSATAIILLGVLINQTSNQISQELNSRKIIHYNSKVSSGMTHLMLLSIRRSRGTSDEEMKAHQKIKNQIDSDMKKLYELETSSRGSIPNELELVRKKIDSIERFSDETAEKPISELADTLKKLVNSGELTSLAFNEAGSLLNDLEELDSLHAQRMIELRGKILSILAGASILVAVLTLLAAIQLLKDIISRLNNVAENARNLSQRKELTEPSHPKITDAKTADEIAYLDAFFFEAAQSIAKMEKERKELSNLLREELKTPLLSLNEGFGTILDGASGLNEKGKTLIQKAVPEIRRLSDLADDLLVLNSLEESGELGLEVVVKPVDANDIVSQSIDAIKPMANLKGIDITYEAKFNSRVAADPARSIQILVNLLSNAVKFSPEKSTIIIQEEIKDGMVKIIVCDSGRGISEKDADKVFARFDQMEKDDQSKGSGLGLFISKKLAEAQEGDLNFTSTVGVGTKFWLALPESKED